MFGDFFRTKGRVKTPTRIKTLYLRRLFSLFRGGSQQCSKQVLKCRTLGNNSMFFFEPGKIQPPGYTGALG